MAKDYGDLEKRLAKNKSHIPCMFVIFIIQDTDWFIEIQQRKLDKAECNG
jgi:hypothetical protein